MFKQLLLSPILLVCSFQLAFAKVAIEYHKLQLEHESLVHKLREGISQFKEDLYGREIPSHCSENRLDEQGIEKILEDAEKNFCEDYTLIKTHPGDKLSQVLEDKGCEKERTKGFIDNIVIRISQIEDKTSLERDSVIEEGVLSFYQKASKLKKNLDSLFREEEIHLELKREILTDYIQAVPLGVRDLVFVTRNYRVNQERDRFYYDSLMPQIPTQLYSELEDETYELSVSGRGSTAFERLMFGDKADYLLEVSRERKKENRVQLRFNEAEMVIRRDIGVLLKALTKKNYLTALRMLTIFMMSRQIRNYSAIIGYENIEQDRGVRIPKSCQSKRNGGMPEKLNINFSEHAKTQQKIEDDMIYKILFSEGLISLNEKPKSFEAHFIDSRFEERFIDNTDLNPLEDGFSGNTFFENYKMAKESLKVKSSVDIDDISQFEAVWGMKISALEEIYSIRGQRGKKTSRNYQDFKRVQNFLDFPDAKKAIVIENFKGEEALLYPFNLGINQYLAQLMQRRGVLSVSDIVPDKLKIRLKKQMTKIPFPRFYSPGPWRQSALKQLANFSYNYQHVSRSSPVYKAIRPLCRQRNGVRSRICGRSGSHIIKNLSLLLDKFRSGERYIPLRKLESEYIQKYWGDLAKVWEKLSFFDLEEMKEMATNQYDFILDQIRSGNKWAVLKLSYLVAINELKNKRDAHQPQYKKSARGKKLDDYSRCYYAGIDNELSRLIKFGSLFKLDQNLLPFHGNKILNNDEKQQLAQHYIKRRDDQVANIYDYRQGEKSLYDIFDQLNYKTILSEKSLNDFVEKNLSSRLSLPSQKEIRDVLNLDLSDKVETFMQIYQARDDRRKQYHLFRKVEKQFEDYKDNVYQFKNDFLVFEDLMKTPVYKDLARKAALFKINEVYKVMNEFCAANDDDHETLKAIYFATTKIQNEMNKALGIESVPDELMHLVKSMPTQQKWDMALGVGSIVLGMSVLLLSAGTVGIGGVLASYIAVASRGALGMQMLLVPREAKRKLRADEFESFVQDMEKVGGADPGASENVSVGWTWTAIEAISILPLIGVVARGMNVGDKAFKEALKTRIKNSKKADGKMVKQLAKESGRTVALEKEVMYAEYILGYRSAFTDLKGVVQGKDTYKLKDIVKSSSLSEQELSSVIKELNHLEALYKMGEISLGKMTKEMAKIVKPFENTVKVGTQRLYRYSGQMVVQHETAEIYKRGAKVITEYFSHRPEDFLKLLQSYNIKWFSRTSQLIGREDKGLLHFLEFSKIQKKGKLEHIQKLLLEAKTGQVGGIRSWFREFRYGHLVEVSPKLTKITDELRLTIKNNGDFEKFILNNIKDLTTIFKKIPMRKRELPYMFILQGGPHLGVRMPLIGDLADGIILRKMTNAISRLAEESLQREARQLVGMNASIGTYSAMKAFDAITNSIGAAIIEADSLTTAKNLASKLHAIEDKVFEDILKNVESKAKLSTGVKDLLFGKNIADYKKFLQQDKQYMRRVIFAPRTAEEVILSESLWRTGFKTQSIWKDDLPSMALEALEQLKGYKGLDQFWDYMRLFRMIVGFKDQGLVEIL